MPRFSAFTPFGMFRFSSRKPTAQAIYESLRDGQGDAYSTSWDGIQQARNYATAMCLGSAQLQVDRAANNAVMMKATEMIPAHEDNYQVIPSPTETIPDRRTALAAARALVRGNARSILTTILQLRLGSGFLALVTCDAAHRASWPYDAENPANWVAATTPPLLYQTTSTILTTGTVSTVSVELLNGSALPSIGDTLVVEAGRLGLMEKVTVTATTPATSTVDATISAVFSRVHPTGSMCTTAPFPFWAGNQRHLYIVVTQAVIDDRDLMRWLRWYLGRALRGNSTWTVTTETTPGSGTIGPWRIGAGLSAIGVTPIKEWTFEAA